MTESNGPIPLSPDDAEKLFDRVLISGRCEDLSAELRRLGLLIDLGNDLGRKEGPVAAIERLGELLSAGDLTPRERAVAHYFLSNAWDAVRKVERSEGDLHAWEQPEIEHQVINLRHAVRLAREEGIETVRTCQMLTNLGNLLSHCGRVIEALDAWDAAIERDAGFAMALGNRGRGLFHYAFRAHDPGHQVCLLREAYASLRRAVAVGEGIRVPEVKAGFEALRTKIEEVLPAEVLLQAQPEYNPDEEWTQEELRYRRWCLKHRLFLNDLNDVDLGFVAAADVLSLPSLTTAFDAPQPSALGFMNQLKQEFVSARFMLYDGTGGRDVHFSDHDVTLVNTLDYPVYGLSVEEVKCAFRIAYSLFDKIAYFLNDYFELGIPETRIAFRSLWYVKGEPKRGLRREFEDSANRGLIALFWLAKDLYDPRPEFAEAIEPDAQQLAVIRNHLEHKYLKVHQYSIPLSDDNFGIGYEALAFSVTRRDFEDKALRVLRLARAALLYLVHAVHIEEQRRSEQHDETLVAPMFLDVWEDDWKM